MIGIKAKPAIITTIIERMAVASERHSAMNCFRLIVVPIEKTMKMTPQRPSSVSPACLMMSGGITFIMKKIRKSPRLTKTAETFALVATQNVPDAEKDRLRNR